MHATIVQYDKLEMHFGREMGSLIPISLFHTNLLCFVSFSSCKNFLSSVERTNTRTHTYTHSASKSSYAMELALTALKTRSMGAHFVFFFSVGAVYSVLKIRVQVDVGPN